MVMFTKKALIGVVALMALFFAATAQAQWTDFTSSAGRYSVAMPGAPQTNSQAVDTKVGKVTATMSYVEIADRVYMVTFNDYPAGSVARGGAAKVLDGVINGIVGSLPGGQKASDRAIDIDGKPGREVTVTGIQGAASSALIRVLVVGDRLYQLMALGAGNQPSDPDAQRFVQSFRLTR